VKISPKLIILTLAIITLLILVCALACVVPLRDTLSLIYWRAREFSIPRAVGSGPRTIIPATDSLRVGVNLAGISVEEWKVSHVWVPATQSLTASTNRTIMTLGAWWDDHWVVTALPTDTNGTLTNAIVRSVGLANGPLQTQIAYEAAAAAGRHLITPPKIGARGDGFFLVLDVGGLDATAPIRDSGQTRVSHPMFGHGDTNSIESISVSTDGTAAQVGDLAVAVFALDQYENPDMHIDLPEGWTSLGFNNAARQNICYRACCKIVTEAGRQSATCTWSDDSTFVAEAALVVFKTGRLRLN
jgi:hypothetical protein